MIESAKDTYDVPTPSDALPEPNALQWRAGVYQWFRCEGQTPCFDSELYVQIAFGGVGRHRSTAPGEAFKRAIRQAHAEWAKDRLSPEGHALHLAIKYAVAEARAAKVANPGRGGDSYGLCEDPEFL